MKRVLGLLLPCVLGFGLMVGCGESPKPIETRGPVKEVTKAPQPAAQPTAAQPTPAPKPAEGTQPQTTPKPQ